jgi:hypothetical protein
MIYCSDVVKAKGLTVGCCDSCHEDHSLGYDPYMIQVEVDGQTACICCAVYNQLDDGGAQGEPTGGEK